jgi:hypothetical protein
MSDNTLKPKAKILDEIKFEDHTREEVIAWLEENGKKNRSYERLAKWIAESAEFDRCNHKVRVVIADAERAVKEKVKWSSEF